MAGINWRSRAEAEAAQAEAEAKRTREQQILDAAKNAYTGLQQISNNLPADTPEQKAIHRINDVVKGLIRLTVRELL